MLLDNLIKEKYKELVFIDNPYYNTCNNISSLYVARDYLENCMIMDADQIIYNPNILSSDFDKSGYNCTWTNDYTSEWLLTTNEQGFVTSCSRTGGKEGWRLYSISRWNQDDGIKLKKHLEEEFSIKNNTEIYWDDIALFCYPDDYQLVIYEMKENDMLEIDSIEELVTIDKNYKEYMKRR